MPQIEQIAATYASQIFWLLVTFGLVFFVIGRGMLPKVQETVDARDKTIADDLSAAHAARETADRAEETWRTRENANREAARKVVIAARADAAKETEGRLAEANAATATSLAEAEARITAASAEAMASIETVAAEAAQDIVARISGAQASADEARAAVKVALANG